MGKPARFASSLAPDVRLGLRQLGKSPGFTVVAVLSLALGIGANTAVFSLINDVLLRSLPVKNPGELVLFRNVQGAGGRMSLAGENNGSLDPATGRESSTSFSLLAFERFRERHPSLSDVFAYAPFNEINLLVDGQPETDVLGQLVSGNYHTGLGVPTIVGRTLTPADDLPSAEPAAVISHRYWQRRFGGDPSVIGRTVQVNRVPVTIVGVTPPGFAGALQVGESADISVPLALHARFQPDRSASRDQPWYWWIRVMGRLAPHATAAQARASLEPALQSAAREGWLAGRSLASASGGAMPAAPTLAADPGGQGENDTRRRYRLSLRILMGLVGLVLLAACTNVANLLLARGAARRREIALRLALGASRVRIVRQLLVESLLLAGIGATLGTLLAYWGRGLLVALRQFSGSPLVLELPLDRRVLGFTIAVAVGTALLFGLAPALRAARLELSAEFQGGARQLGAGARSRLSQGLMVVQIALSLVLLVGTGLFVRTLRNLQAVDPGFNPRRLVLFDVDAHTGGYARERFAALQARVQERLARIPGVRAATFSSVPLLSGVRSNRRVFVPGTTPPAGGAPIFNTNGVAPNFLEAMEIPLLRGRSFTDRDTVTAPKVAVVNQALAGQLFGRENPLGRHIRFGALPTAGQTEMEIVGIVRDAKYTGLRQAAPPTVYLPAAQQLDGSASYSVRTAGNPAAMFAAIRSAVREVDPTLPVVNLRTQEEQIERNSAQERLFAELSGFFGLVLRESAALVTLGAALGIVGAYGASRLVSSLLFGLSPGDPLTYGSVALLLGALALAASLLPARRAARVNPLEALRAD